ncbi:zinc-dependent metalloprotease [Flavobacterium sp. RSB2_4_14]|uniref:zinc-dependent metalloprotease n=1 Tax=Flavobacterium sp. RSB2_4_14 TaxID=3447665 RepID=UPI003F34C1EC
MKKNLLLVILTITVSNAFSQRSNIWQIFSNDKAINTEKVRETPYSQNQKLVQFNPIQFKQLLSNVATKSSGLPGVEITLPNVNGTLEKFMIWESSNFEPALQASYPDIRAFIGKGVTDPSATLNFSFSPLGIQTMIFRAGSGTEFIEPYTKDRSVYVVFDSKTRTPNNLPFVCSTDDVHLVQDLQRNGNVTMANNQVYKTMRLALSCTGEYAQYHGGTVALALAAMNATMTRCNGVFEKDLAIKLLIIANNNLVVYTNASTDPYSPASGMNNWNSQLQTTLTSVIGAANYDIGHLFGATGGGGNAGCIGCVCVDAQKGSGITSPADGIPTGDTFDLDYVAHEMGHQMGANHTFTHTTENNGVNVEPGSGSTIMAYAGIGGGGTDMQSNTDDYFTYRSILQIQSNMNTKTCPISTSIAATNPRPTVSAGSGYTIPVSTAFKLTGSGTGTAGEVLTYNWEQNNPATVVGGTSTFPSPTKTNGPNFRSVLPSEIPVRYMPAFESVLAGQLVTTWETVSSVPRSLAFTLTVRDNVLGGGQTNTGQMIVTVVDAGGAFEFTSPNADASWQLGSSQTITWNVAGTTANGMNTANVNILISTDGGTTFTTLVGNTANDGTETITMPNTPTQNCRLLIEAVGNIFYAVSKNISLGYDCNVASQTPGTAIADGLGANSAGAAAVRTINFPSNVTINNMKASFSTGHTWIGDLVVKLKHPDGTEITLWNRTCNNPQSSGMNVTFADGFPAPVCGSPTSGTFSPVQALAAFNGKPSNGTWTLTVQDFYNGDTGNINSWGIDFGCTLGNEEFDTTDLAVYPNPNRGNFTLQYNNPISNEINVTVFDMRGRKIYENSFSNQATINENIQLNNAQAGIYLMTVTDGNRKEVKKIVVE